MIILVARRSFLLQPFNNTLCNPLSIHCCTYNTACVARAFATGIQPAYLWMFQCSYMPRNTDRRRGARLCCHYHGVIGEVTFHFFPKFFESLLQRPVYKTRKHLTEPGCVYTRKIRTVRQG